MLTIVGLLYGWEKSVEWIRRSLPKSLLPVVESILAEMGGLGFIGLLLQTFLGGANHQSLEQLSVQVFGKADVLLETFEFLHTAFFQVGVGFFVAAGAMVAAGISKLDEMGTIESLQMNAEGACTATPATIAKYLPAKNIVMIDDDDTDTITIDQPTTRPSGDGFLDEIFMGKEERAAKVLLWRHRFLERFDLPETFRVETYVQGAFAENLLEMVELSPLTWIYLIPALALANSIDLSHGVVNAASPNAADSVGFLCPLLGRLFHRVSLLLCPLCGAYGIAGR